MSLQLRGEVQGFVPIETGRSPETLDPSWRRAASAVLHEVGELAGSAARVTGRVVTLRGFMPHDPFFETSEHIEHTRTSYQASADVEATFYVPPQPVQPAVEVVNA